MSVPGAAVFLKVDTLGDLVLFAPTLRALHAAWPQARLVAIVRHAYTPLAPLLAPGIEWLGTSIDPFTESPSASAAEFGRLREAVKSIEPDILVAATSRPNWLESALAATCSSARRVALGEVLSDEFFDTQLRIHLDVDSAAAFSEVVATQPDEPDWQRNLRVADTLLGELVERQPPKFAVPEELADPVLAERGLTRGRYVVCAAAGFANVRIKTWPAARFAAAIAHLRDRHGLPTLLIGQESERPYLEEVVRQVSDLPRSEKGSNQRVGDPPHLWIGSEGDLSRLASLIAGASLYFGNDTGALHLAAALDVPVVGVFGGGTWPRFVPAARRGVALVHPLPCFGCGWDCAFGDAPCLGEITTADALLGIDRALSGNAFEIHRVEHLAASTQDMMAKAASRYREARADHLARQHKLEELTALDREKDGAIAEKEAAIAEKEKEIDALKITCNEREKTIFILDEHVRNFQSENGMIKADKAVLEKTLASLPEDAAKAAETISNQIVHIRNIEALLQQRDAAIAELESSSKNRAAGLHELEQAKHYGKLLAEKEAVIRALHNGLAQRESLIKQLLAESTGLTAKLRKLWIATRSYFREKWRIPVEAWLFKRVVDNYWMQIGILRHYAPRPLQWDDRLPGPRQADASLPQVAVVTPSYGQEKFIERTLRSVLDQAYPKLVYVVQDGGSKDGSPAIIATYANRLRHWESAPDQGQADAVRRGFAHLGNTLAAHDIMAWLNSDDLLAPGSLRFVAEYFTTHPEVDVLYGHRIIIDDDDRDIGRWIMPRHEPATLEWIDYVPQETLFWRKRAWDVAGGIDPSFQFALDWDLLARFQRAGCKMVRVPYFLGAFRVHAGQKTSQAIHTTGADEMRRIRTRFHGERQDDFATIEKHARHARFWGAITARLHEAGIRW